MVHRARANFEFDGGAMDFIAAWGGPGRENESLLGGWMIPVGRSEKGSANFGTSPVNVPCRTSRPSGTAARNTGTRTWLRWPSAEPGWNLYRIWCYLRWRTCGMKKVHTKLHTSEIRVGHETSCRQYTQANRYKQTYFRLITRCQVMQFFLLSPLTSLELLSSFFSRIAGCFFFRGHPRLYLVKVQRKKIVHSFQIECVRQNCFATNKHPRTR